MLNELFNRRNVRATVWGLVLLLAVAMLPQGSAEDAKKFKPFKMKTLDGTQKTLADYMSKATLVGFFFPSCPYCKVSMPETQKLFDKYKDQGLSEVWINVVPQEVKKIPGWMAEHNFTVPVLIGKSQASLMRDYDLKSTPTYFLLGPNGEVVLHQDGYKAGDEKVLEAKIIEALKITP